MNPIVNMYSQCVGLLVLVAHKINIWLLMPSLLILVLLDIILRNVFTYSFSWSHEVSGLLLLTIFFTGLPYCLSKNEFLKVDLLFNYLPSLLQSIVNFFILLCCLSVSVFLVWQGVVSMQDMYEFEEEASSFAMPLWPFAAMIVMNAGLMVMQTLLMMFKPRPAGSFSDE